MAAKISPPPCDRSGVVGTGALEELKLTAAYYKTTSPKSEQKEVFNKRKTRKQLTDA